MVNKSNIKLAQLTPEEHKVIDLKETERPYTGEYWDFFKEGLYTCRKCGLPLFSSKAKFDAGCGWPSFNKTYPHAVKELLDADGERTEILCARCGAHLGHVFRGEQLTETDTRHCANSLSLKFIPGTEQEAYLKSDEHKLKPQEIIIGGGCFWCIESAFLRLPGVLDAISGYAGGFTGTPTYEQVSSGETGHAEVVKITYDVRTLSLNDLLDVFFMVHDPTSINKQGNDIGEQYRSVIFYQNEEEKRTIESHIAEKNPSYGGKIVTQVLPLEHFHKAEEYHQRYYEKNPYVGYCQVVVRPKVEKVQHEATLTK